MAGLSWPKHKGIVRAHYTMDQRFGTTLLDESGNNLNVITLPRLAPLHTAPPRSTPPRPAPHRSAPHHTLLAVLLYIILHSKKYLAFYYPLEFLG